MTEIQAIADRVHIEALGGEFTDAIVKPRLQRWPRVVADAREARLAEGRCCDA